MVPPFRIKKMKDQDASNCYHFESFGNEEKRNLCWTSQAISATYVLHLDGNGRYDQIVGELNEIRPSEVVWILHNKGFRKCTKNDRITIPPQDIVDAYIVIFQHADKQGYKNILILEDDFLFDVDRCQNTTYVNHIESFLSEIADKDQDIMYHIGTLPIAQWPVPWNSQHNFILVSAGTHAAVYSKKYRKWVQDSDVNQIQDWDVYMIQRIGKRYCYQLPLVYQLFPDTDNSRYWGYHDTIMKSLSCVFHFLNNNWLELDTKVEPGYSTYYMASKIVFLLLLALLLWIMYLISCMLSSGITFATLTLKSIAMK